MSVYAALESIAAGPVLERVKGGVVQVRQGRPGRGRTGAGSGIVWRPGGIVTNAHVVAGQERAGVITASGQELEARVAHADAHLDLALLVVDEALEPLPVADSSRLRLGELVFAVGHPWGQPWFSTSGIVSGLGPVSVPGSRTRRDLIRSDVQLRPGNSGGALVNAHGEVVGINSMVWSGDLGVAVPSHVAGAWLARQTGPAIGVGLQPVRDAGGHARLMIVHLEPGGPADRAGLRLGDVLLEAQGSPLAGHDALLSILEATGPRERLELLVQRAGRTHTVAVTPEARKRAA